MSGEIDSQVVVVQDPLQGLVVNGCDHKVLLGQSLTMTASQTQGTDIVYSWVRDGAVPASGSSIIVHYSNVGVYSVNVTANNYVSTDTKHCEVTYLGPIGNLKVVKSQYNFVLFPITFTVTGDYIDPANFTYSYSTGGPSTKTTTSSTIVETFSNTGNFTLTVTVDNGVSQATYVFSFTIENLQCNIPTLFLNGNSVISRLRSRESEISVNVDTKNCKAYTSQNKWLIYPAASCQSALTTPVTLNSTILTSTPDLVLPARGLAYGTYCLTFTHAYNNTPVTETIYANLTIVSSNLVAVISGGQKVSRAAGGTLKLVGSASYDPDDDQASLTYAWSCTQTAVSISIKDFL